MSAGQVEGTEVLLELRDVRRAFGGVVAVDDVSMDVRQGTVLGLMGPNGAGKTSLVNLISGFYSVDSGSVRFAGSEITNLRPHDIARRGITRTYQNVRLFSGMTVVEQVVCGMYSHRKASSLGSIAFLSSERRDRREATERAHALLDEVGVEERHELAERLPYGTQRRVEIARALATQPQLILLDEPTAGMNHAESTAIGELMRRLQSRGTTVVVIEHNMRLILDYCDEAFVMSFGRELAKGAPSDCVRDPEVQRAYFGKEESRADGVAPTGELRSH